MTAPDLKSRILEAARKKPSPTRTTVKREGGLAFAGSAIVLLAFFFALDGPQHGQGRPRWFYAATSLGWGSVATAAMWAALARGPLGLGHGRAWLVAFALGTPIVLLAMMVAFGAIHPEGKLLHPERLGLKCFGLTLAAGIVLLMALAAWKRGSDPVHPAITGASLGVACGAWAGVMVDMWCPVVAPAHIAFGHILPIVLVGIAGVLVGSRFIAMRDG